MDFSYNQSYIKQIQLRRRKEKSYCKKYIKEVNFSVVDEINEQEIKESQELADKMNIPLRVRHKN